MTWLKSLSLPEEWFPKQGKWNWWITVALVIAFALLSYFSLHIGYIDEDKQATINAIAQFHDRLNTKAFDLIYNAASHQLQEANSRDSFEATLQAARNSCGVFRNAISSQINISFDSALTTIDATYTSAFENVQATEFFTFERIGDELRLANYHIIPGTIKAHADEIDAAERAAERFFDEMSNQEFDAIWNEASPDFKGAKTNVETTSTLKETFRKWGICRSPTLVDVDFAEKNGRRFVGLAYALRCSHGDLRKRLAWEVIDGKALLRGYY